MVEFEGRDLSFQNYLQGIPCAISVEKRRLLQVV